MSLMALLVFLLFVGFFGWVVTKLPLVSPIREIIVGVLVFVVILVLIQFIGLYDFGFTFR